ncbi:MAG: metallophosphoesterase [Proteobacteria bacterium]|nr:metallophosphoesterase [Pseudomonadota bacterium]
MWIRFGLRLFVVFSFLTSIGQAAEPDPVVFRFATVGDSRADPGDPQLSAQDSIWLQSTRVLARMLREIQQQHPQALIFNGDMIYGYSAERALLDRQYAFWRGMMAQLFETGTYVLPVPGNHEVQVKATNPSGETTRRAVVSGEQAWRGNMGDLILNAPLWQQITQRAPRAWNVDHAPGVGSDGITTDQRQLSYSFDIDDVHLVVINTDPVGYDASAPVSWLAADFAAAKARGAKHIFVFGHKMAFTYMPGRRKQESGFDVRKPLRDAFWDLVEEYQATYFCGHEHVFHASQPRKASGGKAWQVIVGSGGSPLSIKVEDSTNPADRMYAWADVTVYRSGRVHVVVQGFDESFGPTRVVEEWDLSRRPGQ